MSIIINPGTEPVDEATEANARDGVIAFIKDLASRGVDATWDGGLTPDGEGRWDAALTAHGRARALSMPGCDPEVTRAGTPWVSPRLYVDGDSWLWQYALAMFDPDDADAEH